MSALLEWVDAETPHAKVPRETTPGSGLLGQDTEVEAAVARIRAFEASLLRETREQPLVVFEDELA